MNDFCIMRFQKYQKNSCAKIDRHNNNRKHLKNRKHSEWEKYNITKKKYDMTITQIVNKKIKEIKARTGKNTAKNRVCVAEFVMTFSPEQTENILKNRDKWIMANIEWIKEEFEKRGAELIRFDYHMDESTPHLHLFVLTTDEKGVFNGSHFFAKKSMLEHYQDSYAKAMEPFGLKRGVSKSETNAKHITKTEYLKNETEKVEKQINLLKDDSERIENKRKELKKLEHILEQKREETQKAIDSIFDDEKASPTVIKEQNDIAEDILA